METLHILMKSENFQRIRQLYAKRGKQKTELLYYKGIRFLCGGR